MAVLEFGEQRCELLSTIDNPHIEILTCASSQEKQPLGKFPADLEVDKHYNNSIDF